MDNKMNIKFQRQYVFKLIHHLSMNPNVVSKTCSLLDSPDYKPNSSTEYIYICALKKNKIIFR